MSLKRKILIAFAVVALPLVAAAAWMFGPALMPSQNIDAGIAKGARAPIEMPLRDAAGRPTTLAQQMGQKGVVLFLVRSVDWCPFCKAQLVRTNALRNQSGKLGYKLASLSYDKPELLAEFAQENDIGFALLSDEGSQMIDALGLRDPQYGPDSFANGVPRASTLVIARDGTVQAKYVAADYRSRVSDEEVLAMIGDAAR